MLLYYSFSSLEQKDSYLSQHDDAFVHMARFVKTFVGKEGEEDLDWPAPNPSPAYHFLGWIGTLTAHQTFSCSICADLTNALVAEWTQIHPERSGKRSQGIAVYDNSKAELNL